MELHVCGFNAHHQLLPHSNPEICTFQKSYRSPRLRVRCALWSSAVIENDGVLMHRGFRMPGMDPIIIDGPPTRNIKAVFGDTSGVLGALTTDGSLYVYRDEAATNQGPELRKHHFDKESFIQTQHLAIDHLAITENGEVCIITSQSRTCGCKYDLLMICRQYGSDWGIEQHHTSTYGGHAQIYFLGTLCKPPSSHFRFF